LKATEGQSKQIECLTQILEFVSRSSGLKRQPSSTGELTVAQKLDGKSIMIAPENLEDVLVRADVDGRDFIQVNFVGGHKILMTDKLIGFKPAQLSNLDLARLPKVVTTPDISSVFEAIQEALHAGDDRSEDVLVLRRVFEAVVAGGEAIGFDLSTEKGWIARVPTQPFKANA
jgi:hypothetical protein